jgi:hypothetical protein
MDYRASPNDRSPAIEKVAERRLDLATEATRMMAAGLVADRASQRRGSIRPAWVGASEGWVAAHPGEAAATQATLGFVSQIAARLLVLRNQASRDDDQDRDWERMTNEGGGVVNGKLSGQPGRSAKLNLQLG